jgi:hypothetical protein
VPGPAAKAALTTNATPPRREQERNPGQIDPDLAAEDAPGDRVPGADLNQRQEKLIDDAVEEILPASDPIAPSGSRSRTLYSPFSAAATKADFISANHRLQP